MIQGFHNIDYNSNFNALSLSELKHFQPIPRESSHIGAISVHIQQKRFDLPISSHIKGLRGSIKSCKAAVPALLVLLS
jgi:hypothetical protein